jgi:hypothetical protein
VVRRRCLAMRWCDASVVAASSRPRFGPSGPIWVWAGQAWPWLYHFRRPERWLGLGVAGRRRAYCSTATGASRACGLGRARGPGLLLLLRPVGNRHWRRRLCPPACPLFSSSLFPVALFRFRRSHYFGHGETALVIARSWWRELVGGEFGGVRWSVGGVVFLGVWRNPCRKAGTDAVTPMGAAIPF